MQGKHAGLVRCRDIENDIGNTDAESVGHGYTLPGLQAMMRVVERNRKFVLRNSARNRGHGSWQEKQRQQSSQADDIFQARVKQIRHGGKIVSSLRGYGKAADREQRSGGIFGA